MCAKWLDINIDRGATYNNSVTLTDVNHNPTNLTNVLITGTIKKSYITQNVAANIVCTVANTQSGVIYITLPYTTTSNLLPYRYVYDVVTLDTSTNIATRVLEGTIYINPSVSITP